MYLLACAKQDPLDEEDRWAASGSAGQQGGVREVSGVGEGGV
jgi:hypothetical protein